MKKTVTVIAVILIVSLFFCGCPKRARASNSTKANTTTFNVTTMDNRVPILGTTRTDGVRPAVTSKYTSYSYVYTKPSTITLRTTTTKITKTTEETTEEITKTTTSSSKSTAKP